MNVQLLTPAARGAYLDRVQRDMGNGSTAYVILQLNRPLFKRKNSKASAVFAHGA